MELKLKELEWIAVGLSKVKFKMPTKTAYWLGIFSRKIKEYLDEYSEKTNDLLEKYGEKDEDGKFVMQSDPGDPRRNVKLKDPSGYRKELRELGNEKIDIPFRLMPMEVFYPKEKIKEGKEEKEVEPFCTLEDMEVLSRFMLEEKSE